MQNVSSLYTEIAENEYCYKEIRLLIEGTVYGEDRLYSLETEGSVFGDGGEPQLGKAVSRMLTAKIIQDNEITIPTMAEIIPQYRVSDGSQHSEWITKGIFYIDTRQTGYSEKTLEIEAYDAMLKAEIDYPASTLSWPAKDIDVLKEIALHMGVSIDSRTVEAMTGGYLVPFPISYTMREVLGNIAAMYAGCFIMSDAGELLLITLYGLPSVSGLLIDETNAAIQFGGGGIIV